MCQVDYLQGSMCAFSTRFIRFFFLLFLPRKCANAPFSYAYTDERTSVHFFMTLDPNKWRISLATEIQTRNAIKFGQVKLIGHPLRHRGNTKNSAMHRAFLDQAQSRLAENWTLSQLFFTAVIYSIGLLPRLNN